MINECKEGLSQLGKKVQLNGAESMNEKGIEVA
jgi:hypothetical protein